MSDRLRFPDESIQVGKPIFLDPEIDDYYEEDDGLERNCRTCRGDGWEWCEDTDSAEGCWEADCDGSAHTCPNCRGSGLAMDQCFW